MNFMSMAAKHVETCSKRETGLNGIEFCRCRILNVVEGNRFEPVLSSVATEFIRYRSYKYE